MSKQWAQKKSSLNSSLPVQKSSSSQRPFTAPVYDPAAPKQTPSVQAKRRNVDWNRVTVEAQSPAGVKAKLSVGAPGDKYEQEADAMANKVMTMPAPENEKPLQREMAPEEKEEEVQTKPLADSIQREMAPEEKEEEVQTKPLADSIQREMAPEEKEEEVQTKPLADSIQREMAPEEKEEEVQTKPLADSIQREMAPEEKEEEVQTKPLADSIQREMAPEEKEEEIQTKPATGGKSQAGSNLESQLSGTKGGGSALSDEVRSHMEPRFGADFSSVRVHTDSAAVQMNRDLGAQAFTHGSDIYYGGGKSPGKDELTAHELTHVVQQNGGAVQRAPLIQRIGGKQDTEVGRKGSAFNRGGGNQNKYKGSGILIGDTHYKPYDDALIDPIYDLAKPYIEQWGEMDNIFKHKKIAQTKEAKSKYLKKDENKDEESVNWLKNDVRAMLRKYNGTKTFDDNFDLARQVVQDVKLRLLGMEKVIGVDHQDGQFSETADAPKVGRTGKTKTLRIYRTMKAADWNNYTQSQNIDYILKGHGGSLGQAMYYFAKSKCDKKDDVLVEFKFSDTANKLIDYDNIERGGEGKASNNDKLTGKSEQNDIMKLDEKIFSVNLQTSKKHIEQLNPQVTLIDRVKPTTN